MGMLAPDQAQSGCLYRKGQARLKKWDQYHEGLHQLYQTVSFQNV